MTSVFFEIIGWIGMFLILLAYFLVSFKKITPNSASYQWLNMTGAALIFLNVYTHQAYPAAVLNFAWFLIALIALAKKAKF